MFDRIGYGVSLFWVSIQIFIKYPKLLIPIFITWCLYAPTVLYIKFDLEQQTYSPEVDFIIAFLIVLFFAFILTLSCTILLEMVQQIKMGNKPSMTKSLDLDFFKTVVRAFPLVLIWAIIWFITILLSLIFSKRSSGNKEPLTPENAALTLGGQNSSPSTFFLLLQDGLRMLVFLILPAIVWEKVDFRTGIKKGLTALKSHPFEFTTEYLLNELGAMILFLPPGILFYLVNNDPVFRETVSYFGDWFWYLTIIYLAFAWSYCIYLEQMSTAMLYLWDMTWRKQVDLDKSQGKTPPVLQDIPEPDLLDDEDELDPAAKIDYDPPIIDKAQVQKDIWGQPT